jgi:poly-gamma-glutamate synthesis protein (capsule biosynthesis protein)
MDEAHAASRSFKEIQTLNPDWIPDFGSLYNFPTDSRMTLVVKAVIEDGRLHRVSALPAYVNRDAQPEILGRADPRFDQVLAYLQRISDEAGLAVSLEVSGDEILPLPARSPADARLAHA